MSDQNTYNPFRRLHFYAAWLITPLLITLSLSGIGYLFFTNVEKSIYKHEFFGDSSVKSTQSLDEAVQQIRDRYPGFNIEKISLMEEPYNNRVTASNADGDSRYIFLDHNNQMVAEQDAKFTYANVMRNFHSSLFTGSTFVQYLVELTACWAVFLIVSGVYMTFKKKLLSRKKNSKKHPLRFQKTHAFLGLVTAIPLVIIILTGLPWSVFMGNQISTFAQEHPEFGRTELGINPPQSDVNEIPWATRSLDQPASQPDAHAEHHAHTGAAIPILNQLSLESVIRNAQNENISRPFSVVYPSNEQGVFTVSNGSNTGVTGLNVSPNEETTAYFDQYAGNLIARVNYADYGIIGKWFTWGIPLHEGHLFGIANQMLNLIVCLAFLAAIAAGFISWMKKIKPGDFNRPKRINKPWSIGAVVTLLILGILMPLFGLSVLVIFVIETIVYHSAKNNTQPHKAAQ